MKSAKFPSSRSIRSCPSQAPKSAYREDDGDERGHAEYDNRSDQEEDSPGLGDFAADTFPGHVEDGDGQPKERPKEHYDVPRSPFGEHKRFRKAKRQGWALQLG